MSYPGHPDYEMDLNFSDILTLLSGPTFILQSGHLKLQSRIRGYSQDNFQKLPLAAWLALDYVPSRCPKNFELMVQLVNLRVQLVNLAKTYSQTNPDTVRPLSVDIK